MKNTLVFFKNPNAEIDVCYLNNVLGLFYEGAISFLNVEILSSDDGVGFKKTLERNKIACDNLFVLASDDLGFDIKKCISEEMNVTFCENENASAIINKLSKSFNKTMPSDYALIPLDSTLIPNEVDGKQGFMLEEGDFSLIFLPDKEECLKCIVTDFVVKYFEQKYNIKRETFVAKYFGDGDKLRYALKEIEQKYPFVNHLLKESFGDYLVKLNFNGDITKRDYDDVVRLFMTRLQEGIYAEQDTLLENRLFDLLSLRNVKLSTAESFTAGRVIGAVIKNPGASNFVNEGIVAYSNRSKTKRLMVNPEELNTVGAVSSKVAYEMVAGLLSEGDCNLAVSTTGYAGPDTDEFGNQVGLYYIGIGTMDGVDVYKYRASGNREEITERAKNTALFLAIKKLKRY